MTTVSRGLPKLNVNKTVFLRDRKRPTARNAHILSISCHVGGGGQGGTPVLVLARWGGGGGGR